MKRICVLVLLVVCGLAAAEQQFTFGHYSFVCPDGQDPAQVERAARSFNAVRARFAEVFHFDPATDRAPSRVVILADKASFDAYLRERIGETRGDFIFLKYARPESSELVIFNQSASAASPVPYAGPALMRQLFLQYLYAHVSEPPLWMRDGFQAYFEGFAFDPATGEVRDEGGDPWLETAKNLRADASRALAVDAILSAVTGSWESARFYPHAWAFVAFLMRSENPAYQRFLWETCAVLEGSGPYNAESQQGNTDLVKGRFLRFIDAAKADADLTRWLQGQRTFAELLQDGVGAYNAGRYPEARSLLERALAVQGRDPMVNYYLGLVAYAEKDYRKADGHYLRARELGAEVSTVNWALGLNAYADKRYGEARGYLEAARSTNPARYGEKADALLKSMPR